jgi:hypothetical protein
VRFTIFPSISAPTTLQPKIIFWVLACSRQPSKARAIERLGRNPCRIKGAGVDPTPERPVIGVEAVLALADGTAATLTPVAGDPDLAALDKLLHFFRRWRGGSPAARPAGVLGAGVVFRRQCRSASEAPSRYRGPERAAARRHYRSRRAGGRVHRGLSRSDGRVIVSLIQDLNDRLAELFLAAESGQRALPTAEHTIAAYTDALERILGVPAGSVLLVKTQTLRPWSTRNRS